MHVVWAVSPQLMFIVNPWHLKLYHFRFATLSRAQVIVISIGGRAVLYLLFILRVKLNGLKLLRIFHGRKLNSLKLLLIVLVEIQIARHISVQVYGNRLKIESCVISVILIWALIINWIIVLLHNLSLRFLVLWRLRSQAIRMHVKTHRLVFKGLIKILSFIHWLLIYVTSRLLLVLIVSSRGYEELWQFLLSLVSTWFRTLSLLIAHFFLFLHFRQGLSFCWLLEQTVVNGRFSWTKALFTDFAHCTFRACFGKHLWDLVNKWFEF